MSAHHDKDDHLLSPSKEDTGKTDKLFASALHKKLEPSLGQVISTFDFASAEESKRCRILVKEELGSDELAVEYFSCEGSLLDRQQLSADFAKKLQHSEQKLEGKQKSQLVSLRLVRSLKWHKQRAWPEVREKSLNFEEVYHEDAFSQSLLF